MSASEISILQVCSVLLAESVEKGCTFGSVAAQRVRRRTGGDAAGKEAPLIIRPGFGTFFMCGL